MPVGPWGCGVLWKAREEFKLDDQLLLARRTATDNEECYKHLVRLGAPPASVVTFTRR